MATLDVSSPGSEWTVKCLQTDCHRTVCSTSASLLGGKQANRRDWHFPLEWFGGRVFLCHPCSNPFQTSSSVDHRIWVWGVDVQGRRTFGGKTLERLQWKEHGFKWATSGWSVSLKMTFTNTCVSGTFFSTMFKVVIHLKVDGVWSQDDTNKLQASSFSQRSLWWFKS